MAVNNQLAAVIPTLYAQGLSALRSNVVMPRLVLNDFGKEVRQKGEIIQIPLPSAMATNAIVPAAYAPDPQNIAPTTAPIPLDSWYEAPFTLTDKEYAQIIAGVPPIQLTAAIQALAAQVNASIINNCFTAVGNFVGTPGTTPFNPSNENTPQEAIAAGVAMDNFLAPNSDRFIALSPAAYGNATGLQNFAYASYAGDTNAVDAAVIRQKFGFDWYKDQQIGGAVNGFQSGYQTTGTKTGTVTASGAQAAGSTTIAVATGASSTWAPNVGDVITFAGDSQTYAVQAGGATLTAMAASGTSTINILPAKVVGLNGGEAITVKASHVINMAFQRQAFAFASRPETPAFGDDEDDNMMRMVVPDPISGLSMTLELRREFKRTRVAFSMLWGAGPVRPNLACRIAG